MSVIVPTITTADPAEFNANFSRYQAITKRIHIDISDGTFAPTMMVPLGSMTFPAEAQVDLHLMVARPSEHLSKLLELKPRLVILHAEVDDDLPSIFSALRGAGIKTGVALLRGTFPRKHQDLVADVDHAMIFAGKLGEQGGAIDFLQIEKVPLLRALKSDLEIGWDGGANLSNVRALAHAGIDVINVGSALSRAADASAMYQSLVAECEKRGVLV